jgi:hypothetical protein
VSIGADGGWGLGVVALLGLDQVVPAELKAATLKE